MGWLGAPDHIAGGHDPTGTSQSPQAGLRRHKTALSRLPQESVTQAHPRYHEPVAKAYSPSLGTSKKFPALGEVTGGDLCPRGAPQGADLPVVLPVLPSSS